MTWTIHHQMGHVQGPGDWSGTQTAAVPGQLRSCPRKSFQHWYPKKSGAFFGHVPKKKYMGFKVSMFSAELRFKNNRGRPIFSDHLVVKSICFSWLDPHVGCLANEITGTHRDYTWDTWGYHFACTSKKMSNHVVFCSIPAISSLGMGGSFSSGTKESGLNWESPPQRPD